MVVAAAAFASGASAATTIGSPCAATNSYAGLLFNPSVDTVNTSGVVTSATSTWTGPAPGLTIGFSVLKPTGATDQWQVVQSSGQFAFLGVSSKTFPVRLPVSPGQVVAMWGAVPYCPISDTIKFASGVNAPPAGTIIPVMSDGAMTAFSASIEADADGDGFGDETQDKCTQSAKYQDVCPVASAAAKAKAGKTASTFTLANAGDATIVATGTVKLPKTKHKKAKTLKLKSSPVAALPGVPAKVTLKYPSSLKSALKALNKRKNLTLKVKLTSTGLANTATKTYSLKLKGRKK
jgi:hypothetical protein